MEFVKICAICVLKKNLLRQPVQKEGKREVSRLVEFYRLEAILAVGYRVNSAQATDFRKWATQTLLFLIILLFCYK